MAFSNPVVGGENGELIRAAIHSPNYVPGVSGWTINRDGSAEFSNVTIRLDLATGSITVGPSGMPQVIIGSDATSGFIEFPTNAASEVTPASIYSTILNEGLPNERLRLNINGAVNSVGDQLFFGLLTPADDGSSGPLISMIAGSTSATLSPSGGMVIDGEVVVGNGTGLNTPLRITQGIRGTGTTDTTLGNGVDTLIGGAATTSAYLENGVAYRVDIQIIQRSSVGTSAAGTQQAAWKLWDGAVGGTQLGQTTLKMNDNVGATNAPYQFSFLFQHTGTTGSRTINLSGQRSIGADTLQARVNSQYFMLVNRAGDPSKITNL